MKIKEILALIDQKNQAYANLPFFEFIADSSIDPRQKLSFAPIIAVLALEFGKVCNHVFRQEPAINRVQEIVNQHTQEEHFHWQWLLEDMTKLGIDHTMPFTDVVKFIWSDRTKAARSLYPLMMRYTQDADPILRLIAIEVTEVTANVFFEATKPIAAELQAITGQEYHYFGMCHNHVEHSHSLNTPEITEYIAGIELTEELRQQAIELIDVTFQLFTDLMDEFLVFAKAHPYHEPPTADFRPGTRSLKAA